MQPFFLAVYFICHLAVTVTVDRKGRGEIEEMKYSSEPELDSNSWLCGKNSASIHNRRFTTVLHLNTSTPLHFRGIKKRRETKMQFFLD